MASIDRTAYPRFQSSLTANELQALYRPSDEELRFVAEHARGDAGQLTLLALLKCHPQLMERFGQIPPERARVSPTVERQSEMPSAPKPPPLESWHYDPQLFRKWPQFTDERGAGEYTQDVDQGNEVSLGL